jgi:hypothetical protein
LEERETGKTEENRGEFMSRIMVDLETLGQKAGSVIVAVGAVKFCGLRGITHTFYERVSAEDCERQGLRCDAATVLWWLAQDEVARLEILKPASFLRSVLTRFHSWSHEGDGVDEIWGNGASFDPVVLGAAYDACGMERPWKFWNERCFRTMKALNLVEPPSREGVHHNALDDATHQAKWLLLIEAKLEAVWGSKV